MVFQSSNDSQLIFNAVIFLLTLVQSNVGLFVNVPKCIEGCIRDDAMVAFWADLLQMKVSLLETTSV